MEGRQAIDVHASDSEDDDENDVGGEDGCHHVDNGLDGSGQLQSNLLSSGNSRLQPLRQTDDKTAKHEHQEKSTSEEAKTVRENVPDRTSASSNNDELTPLLNCDQVNQPQTSNIYAKMTRESNNENELEIFQGVIVKNSNEASGQSNHIDQFLTIERESADSETLSRDDQLQSTSTSDNHNTANNQLIEQTSKNKKNSSEVDNNSISVSSELVASTTSNLYDKKKDVHDKEENSLNTVQLQSPAIFAPSIEHQLLQQSSSPSTLTTNAELFSSRKVESDLHLPYHHHPLEPVSQSHQSGDLSSVTRAASDVIVDVSWAEEERPQPRPPCDYQLGTACGEESALSSLPQPIIIAASLTSSLPSTITTLKSSPTSSLSTTNLRSAHQQSADISAKETSFEAQDNSVTCQKAHQLTTVGKKLPSDKKLANKKAKRSEKSYALSTFKSDREPSISFLASYPPQDGRGQSSSPDHTFTTSTTDSYTEKTPLLGSNSLTNKSQRQQNNASTSSLSSSTSLSLFLESLKVNTGSKRSLKTKAVEKNTLPTSSNFETYQEHPLANVPDYSYLDYPTSSQMPNKGNYSLGSTFPLQDVVSGPRLEKVTLNRGAAPSETNGHSNPVHPLYGNSNMSAATSLVNANGGGTSSHISSPQQKYLASLLNIEEVNPTGNTFVAGSKPAELPISSRDAGAGGNPLSFQPYPNPKSSTAPAAALPALLASGGPRGNQKPNSGHCNHRNGHHRCYASSGSYDGAGLTTTDDETCSISTSASKHDDSFSLKFPKLRYVKVALLAGLIIYTLISFIAIQEKEEKWSNVAAQEGIPAFVDLSHSLDLMFPVWKLRAKGSFLPAEYGKLTNYSIIFSVVQLLNDSQGADRNGAYRVVKSPWAAPITPPKLAQYMNNEVEHVFKLSRGDAYDHIHRYQLRIDTNSEESVGITVNMAGFSELSADGIILATTVLVFLYTLIIFEIVNRTLAAMLGATAAITCLTLIRDRPSLEKVVSWLDVETLCLLFGMMVLVAILCETGFFDYIAVVAFRLAKGRTWPLIFTLCFFTGILSAFLDNVTTILLMTPVTIRLCEIKNIDPKFVLIAQVMFSNIGGAATPVGDPPNVIIISSLKIQKQGVDFGRFTLHMMPGILMSFAATLLYIRIAYRNLDCNDMPDGPDPADLENGTTTKDNSAAISYQQSNPPGQATSTSGGMPLSHPRSHSEPQFSSEVDRNPFPGGPSGSRRPGRLASASPANQLASTLESSSEFDGYSYGQQANAPRNARLLRSSSGIPKDALEQCFSCNSMDDFCAGASVRDSILDERRVFRSSDELKREIEVWKRATNSISGYSRDENSVRNVLNKKVEILETVLQEHGYETVPPLNNYHSVLAELEEKYKIRDYPLLYKSGIVMSLVISLFFMQSIPNLDLSLGWIAILGAILLLVLADRHEMESIISRVEWSTLIFFAALFVVMEALAELKFLWWIGRLTQDFINSVPEAQRLVVAILLFTWISAFASSFIDNIPLTTVMVKILEDLSENNEFNIPLVPLIYALAFGACLGGNGTLIGASSNVVCAGVAEQHGYRFTFMDFFKVGFPIMLLTVGISSAYLVVCHVVFDWNY